MAHTPSSKYRGVIKVGDRWRSRVFKDGRRQSLGLYDTELEAYQAYLDFKDDQEKALPTNRSSWNLRNVSPELCGSCCDVVTDKNLNLLNPDKFILVNQKKVYFCTDKCMRYYISQPEIWARYNELGFL